MPPVYSGQGCLAWDDLVSKLEFGVDRVILIRFLQCTGCFPDMERLVIRTSVGSCAAFLLIPLAECIRDPETAEVIRWLAVAQQTDKPNLLPLLTEEFFQAINRGLDIRACFRIFGFSRRRRLRGDNWHHLHQR